MSKSTNMIVCSAIFAALRFTLLQPFHILFSAVIKPQTC